MPEALTTPLASLVRCQSYDPAVLSAALEELMAPLGGMGRYVSSSDRVLVKPNFLLAAKPERAVTTHPQLVLAVVDALQAADVRDIVVGDSPATQASRTVAKRLGLIEALDERGVPVINLDDSVVVSTPKDSVFHRLELWRAVLEADRVINLPKLKSHAQMSMTLAVKNCFGAVVGMRKAAWHMEAGRDAELFARMVVDICRRVAPALSIADGVVAMEGNGPNAGDPRSVGVLAAAPDPGVLDQLLCEIVGFPPSELHTLQAWWATGGEAIDDWGPHLAGPRPKEVAVEGFAFARPIPVGGLPGPLNLLRRGVRRLVEVRPHVKKADCSGCASCAKHCPADAIEMRREGKLAHIDPANCIHCFVCQEICPDGAIDVRRGLVRKLLK
jgi:uncharacterized protein (DUF362 family)/Pyruvate/2-oxoacid:ferredoxin oxidoreductase delta subunit